MSRAVRAAARSGWWLTLAPIILLAMASLYATPDLIRGPFIEPVTVSGFMSEAGEIYIKDKRLVHRSATPGYYFVKVHRVSPEPETLICNGPKGMAPYKPNADAQTIELDLGYYLGWPPGTGRQHCPDAYRADVIALDVTWCERHVAGLCLGEVELDVPAVIDLREDPG